jgi:hypothetical protein
VFNIDVAEALQVFQSGLAGEAEPLKRFGINLLQAEVQTYALEAGIISAGEQMTEQQKVQARYGLLMQSTAKTAGDFANTSDGLANSQRILRARLDDVFSSLGGALLPAMASIVGELSKRLIPAFERFSALDEHAVLGAAADAGSRLLWRFPARRLSAEEIRDTLLAVAGQLQIEPMGGPGFRLYKFTQNNVSTYFPLDQHGPETYRRAVYHQNARASVVVLLTDFDFPDIAFAAPVRANTTTPLQALTLFNHRFTLDMAVALAERLDAGDVAGSAYRLAFQRAPTPAEREAAEALVARHGRQALCRALFNANELLFLD